MAKTAFLGQFIQEFTLFIAINESDFNLYHSHQ